MVFTVKATLVATGRSVFVEVTGDSIVGWKLKEEVLSKARTTLVGVDVFGLYSDEACKSEVEDEASVEAAVTLFAKRIDGACVVGVCVRGDEGAVWRASGGGCDGAHRGGCARVAHRTRTHALRSLQHAPTHAPLPSLARSRTRPSLSQAAARAARRAWARRPTLARAAQVSGVGRA